MKNKLKDLKIIFKYLKHCIEICKLGSGGNYFKYFQLLFFSILNSIFEVLPIFIVIPFITIITTPEKVWSYKFLKDNIFFLEINKSDNLALSISLIFIFIVLLSSLMKIIYFKFITNFKANLGHVISKNIFSKANYSSYEFHMITNSNKLIAAFTSQVRECVDIIQIFFEGINSTFKVIFIVSSLFLVSAKISAFIIFGITSGYLTIAFYKNNILRKTGRLLSVSRNKQVKIIQESLGSIRQLILSGNQKFFIHLFMLASNKIVSTKSLKFIS